MLRFRGSNEVESNAEKTCVVPEQILLLRFPPRSLPTSLRSCRRGSRRAAGEQPAGGRRRRAAGVGDDKYMPKDNPASLGTSKEPVPALLRFRARTPNMRLASAAFERARSFEDPASDLRGQAGRFLTRIFKTWKSPMDLPSSHTL